MSLPILKQPTISKILLGLPYFPANYDWKHAAPSQQVWGPHVFSVPDGLITDDTVNPAGKFQGLLTQALETIWRVNMGGPKVTSDNDTLWRTWVSDQSFLLQKNLARNYSNIAAVKYVEGGAARDAAPNIVYGTATGINSADYPSSNFNVTCEFYVDPGFQYHVRFHFCDIVSKGLNKLYFSLYVDSWIVSKDLDLSTLALMNGAQHVEILN